jgi:hypothetical protein
MLIRHQHDMSRNVERLGADQPQDQHSMSFDRTSRYIVHQKRHAGLSRDDRSIYERVGGSSIVTKAADRNEETLHRVSDYRNQYCM